MGKAAIAPETRSTSASRWLGFGGGFANPMSGPGFADDGNFGAAVVCLLGHLHLVDADFDGPTGFASGKHVTLSWSNIATVAAHSGPNGLWPQRGS